MSSTPHITAISKKNTLADLDQAHDFARRHIGPGPEETAAMLGELGLDSLDQLLDQTVPATIRDDTRLAVPEARSESEAVDYLRQLAEQNQVKRSFQGLGYHECHTPAVVLRNILENPGWYTAYTPYQAEISQGRLEALLNFQTMVGDLTGLEIANASLLDEATAAAEGMAMCFSAARGKRSRFWVSRENHPQTLSVLGTRAVPLGIEIVSGGIEDFSIDESFFAMLLPYPTTSGSIQDYRELVSRGKDLGVRTIVATDLLALTLLVPPGEWGADIAVGNSQRFGVPLGFGGPHAGFFATHEEFKRLMPGRVVGVSKDSHGNNALRLALQTREQHIRREKATSNICTAQVLLAVMAGMYAAYHGPDGLRRIARRTHLLTRALANLLGKVGFGNRNQAYFDTLAIETGEQTGQIVKTAAERGFNLRRLDDAGVGISLSETATPQDIRSIAEIFGITASHQDVVNASEEDGPAFPGFLERTSDYLTHPVFHQYHSETEMLRYLNRLQAKDLSLTGSMIPLGSCTMKLNATSEMIPVTYPGFCQIHPFAPLDQVPGYLRLIRELESMLNEITGFAGISLQPNAGSQGEYAGLLIIQKYHRSRGDDERNICLIPSSAHGTNPASAALAGMKVVVVACDDQGNIDLEDLEKKAAANRDHLAALMVTYPSTHGVFEEGIVRIAEIVHEHGGQVYLDGANLNALVGVCRPGVFGPDVAHLNLHKTFCIPHGGGGPGVGPVAVREHLLPFLPSHPLVPECGPESGITAVSAAPWGSAGILPISWAYIALMGPDGLRKATQVAILNANYIAKRLEGHYPVLYTGRNGRVAHECIIDLRPLKADSGVTVDDVAKRLMDYGFHAPTMSFPVAGTLMIEPTESESKAELDRFCDALISIRQEIREIEEGRMDREDNPLHNAPHTIDATVGEWTHPYTREQAVFPLPWVREHKFWSAVGRIDNVYGDRNLVCACPPLESYS